MPVEPLVFSTTDLAPRRQFEAFRAAHDAIVDIAPSPRFETSFAASQHAWDLGKLVLTQTRLPQSGPLRWSHLRNAVLDHWYLVLPCVSVDGELMRPPSRPPPRLYSLPRPMVDEIETDGALTLFIPRDLLASPGLDDLVGKPLETMPGGLLADMMLALDGHLPGVERAEIDFIVEAMRCMLLACANPSRDRLVQARKPIELALLERARRLIRRRLAEADLSPEAICRELGVSRSRLYRLFEPLGGISNYVRHQRLLMVHHCLLDPADFRSIARISEDWGFADASCFSRSYRREFGQSPKDTRDLGRTGARPERAISAAPPGERRLSQLLKDLAA